MISVAECLMKMSKYLSRMFDAMRVIHRSRLPKKDRKGLLDFGTTDDPEFVTDFLLRYKRRGKKLPAAANHFVTGFLEKFKCNTQSENLLNCLKKIHKEVNAYNKKLAANVNEIKGMELKKPSDLFKQILTIERETGGNVRRNSPIKKIPNP